MSSSKAKSNSISTLTEKELETMRSIFQKYPALDRVVLFGSRAMQTHKTASDVDLLLQGKKVDFGTVAGVHGDLEETTIPYFFDVLNENTISSDELKEHIRCFGVEIYRRN